MDSIRSKLEPTEEDIEIFESTEAVTEGESINSRQEMLLGDENIATRMDKHILLVGNGTGNNPVARNLAEKGYNLITCDGDSVSPSNLGHQGFSIEDIGKNKAVRMAKKATGITSQHIETVGIPMFFERASALGITWLDQADAVVTFTDNMASRFEVSNYFYDSVPVISAGIYGSNTMAWLFVQEPGRACLRCCFPNLEVDENDPTSCSGMSLDPARSLSGYISFAIDSIFLEHKYRRRNWNWLKISLDGFVSEERSELTRKDSCEFCHS